MPHIEIAIMRAGDGDCVLIRCLDEHGHFNILVDGGRAAAITHLKDYLQTLPAEQQTIDLLVLTHIDADHIEGALAIARDDDLKSIVKEVWFNDATRCASAASIALSTDQADEFTTLIGACGWQWNSSLGGQAIIRGDEPTVCQLRQNTRVHLLGPTAAALQALAKKWPLPALRDLGNPETPPGAIAMSSVPMPDVESLARGPHSEDDSLTNGSSIAFVLEHGQYRLLIAADSHAQDIVKALEGNCAGSNNSFDLAFLPHHGADGNMSPALAGLINADRWVISTTGVRHRHPSPQSLARVLKLRPVEKPIQLIFNSCHPEAAVWSDQLLKRNYNYEVDLPDDKQQAWVTVSLLPY